MNTLTDIKNTIAAISLLVLVSGCGGGDSSMKNIADGFDFDILPVKYYDGGYTHTGYMNSDV